MKTHLGVTKLALDYLEGIFNFRANPGFGTFNLTQNLVQEAVFLMFPITATTCSNLPDDLAVNMFGTLLDTGIARIDTDDASLAVQRLFDLGNVGHIDYRT
ncbi:MAG: hypothetical protein DU480_08610 [Nitrosomonas sp.]